MGYQQLPHHAIQVGPQASQQVPNFPLYTNNPFAETALFPSSNGNNIQGAPWQVHPNPQTNHGGPHFNATQTHGGQSYFVNSAATGSQPSPAIAPQVNGNFINRNSHQPRQTREWLASSIDANPIRNFQGVQFAQWASALESAGYHTIDLLDNTDYVRPDDIAKIIGGPSYTAAASQLLKWVKEDTRAV